MDTELTLIFSKQVDQYENSCKGLANILGAKFLISILKNRLVEIKALGPNLDIYAIKSTIEGRAGSSYHDHQNCCLCLSATVQKSLNSVTTARDREGT